MKKISLVLAILALAAGGSLGQDTQFFERVTGHLDCQNCYFVVLRVRSEGFDGIIAAENDHWFEYFSGLKKWNRNDYSKAISEILRTGGSAEMESVREDSTGHFLVGKKIPDRTFRVVKTSQAFEVIRSQGCESVLTFYFMPKLKSGVPESHSACRQLIQNGAEDLYLKPRTSIEEQSALIAMFFSQEIPLRLDDISGSLKIGYLTVR